MIREEQLVGRLVAEDRQQREPATHQDERRCVDRPPTGSVDDERGDDDQADCLRQRAGDREPVAPRLDHPKLGTEQTGGHAAFVESIRRQNIGEKFGTWHHGRGHRCPLVIERLGRCRKRCGKIRVANQPPVGASAVAVEQMVHYTFRTDVDNE